MGRATRRFRLRAVVVGIETFKDHVFQRLPKSADAHPVSIPASARDEQFALVFHQRVTALVGIEIAEPQLEAIAATGRHEQSDFVTSSCPARE